MAYCLEVAIIDGGDRTIKVTHQFWGYSRREVDTYKREHLGSCEYFRSAETQGRTLESLEEIDDDELPNAADYEDDDVA